MSKLTKALIPGYGANPTKPTSNPFSGLAPNLENGLPQGLPSGIGKAALKFSNPVGGISPDINGDIGYQKGWLDQSSNGTPDAPAKGPQHSIWGDPDMSKRGWGWGMDSTGKLQEGVHGGGPMGSDFGPPGSTTAPGGGYGPGMPGTPGAPGGNTGVASPQHMPGMQGPMSPGQGMQIAQQMRQGAPQGQPAYQPGQQGAAMPPGGPQGPAGMGGQPGAPSGGFTVPQQFPPAVPGTAAYAPQQGQGVQALIAQLRQQQPQVGMGQSAQ